MNRGSQRAVQMATDRTNQAYTPYEGQRIADLSPNEREGISMARNNQDYASARGAYSSIGSMADEGALKGYMNPYMEQVLQPQLRQANEAFESERAQMQAEAGMRGAFGSRTDVAQDRLAERHQTGVTDMYGQAYGQAFDRATTAFQQEQDRKIRQGEAFQNLGTQSVRDLMQTGLVGRTRDQAEMDFKYLEHLEARDWDVSNLDTLVKTLASVPHETTQESESTQTVEKKGDPLKTIAGIAAITAGAIMTGGASLAAMGAAGAAGGGGAAAAGAGLTSAGATVLSES